MALSAQNRLRRPADFKHVLSGAQKASRTRAANTGGRAGDGLLLVSAVPSANPEPRVGLSVSKRVGGSVTRNRVKRRLREIFKELVIAPEETDGRDETSWDFVASARPDAADATYEELKSSARRLISRVTAQR